MELSARLSAVLLCAMLVLWALPLEAEWIEDGMPICTEQYAQEYMQIIEDGHGGAIIVWSDYRTPTGSYLYHDIYAQRLDKRGNELWASGGIPICTDTLTQYMPEIVPDGYGNFIIAWTDARNSFSDIYAQRIDIDGNALWTEGGIAICSETSNQGYLRMIPVEGGGAIIAWLDWRNGGGWDIYAQRIDTSGTALWTAGGVAACTETSSQDDLEICYNGRKGVYLVWEDLRNGNYDIYMNMIDSTGSIWCTTDGYPVCTDLNTQFDPCIAYNGTNDAIVIWVDNRNGNNDIYGQRMGGCYNSWAAAGVPICTASGTQNYPILIELGDYSFVASWRDERNTTDVDLYATRFDIFANKFWGTDGVLICSELRDQAIGDIIADGAGNLFFAWFDSRNVYQDIYVQKTDLNGNVLWNASGVPLSKAYDNQNLPVMAIDDEGGAIVAWLDNRNWQTISQKDIYGQRIDGSGVWGYPAPAITAIEDVPHDQGGQVTVAWDPSPLDIFPYTDISHYSIWRNLEAAQASALYSSGEKSTPLSAVSADFEGTAYRFIVTSLGVYGWEWIGNVDAHRLDEYTYTAATLYDSTGADDGVHHFFVASHSDDPYVYWDSEPDSGYSVDNLAPCPPVGASSEQQYDPEGLLITWEENSELDLGGYRIYRGTESGFTPAPGNMLVETCDTEATDDEWRWDERYYYKICAYDVHGNESSYVLLAPGDVTDDETPRANFLSQNYPNPFNPSTSIRFGLKEAADVDLRIYDAAGRLVRVLVDEQRKAGAYDELWNGRDNEGREVASGIYFYRLEAGAFMQTRKMVLLR